MEHPESYELSLWKIGEQLDYSQCQILGEKLRIKRAKLRNIYAKVQSGICSQEEMNFEILHKWMANQTPRDNPVAYLKDILVKDLEFHRDDVQAMFKRETLLSESTTERSLGELQFYQIAEKVDQGLHIPLTLRLGLTFTDLQVSRQNNGGNAVQSLFEMLCRWQKALPSKIDQLQSMCNILEASEQKLLAYSIEFNTWGVENKSGKRIMLFETPKSVVHEELLSDENLHINLPMAARIESLLKITADISERIPSQSDLTRSKLKEMYDDCRRISQFLSNIQRAVGIQPMYELFGFTMSSFFLHVRALSDKGLARLKEDMSNGSIASRLEKELDTSELASEILSQMSLAREAIDQSAKHTANVTDISEADFVRTNVMAKEARRAEDIHSDKVFNDPIHSSVPMPPYCQMIIDTPEFQRLRFIKQLGCTCYVFPSAVHTRFEHSIGVSHCAGKLANMLLQNDFNADIQKNEVVCVEIAGLCHDLGHGPFLHAFEDIIPPNKDGTKWTHKEQSVKIFKHLIVQNNLEQQLAKYSILQSEIEIICELILGHPRKKGEKLLRENKYYLHQIVCSIANKVDVNKWDYLARDSLYLGMKSAFDFNRIVPFVKVLKVERDGETRKELCFRDKVANDLNHMFLTRRRLHYAAYEHRVTKIISIMLKDAFRAAAGHLQFIGLYGRKYNLLESVKDPMAFCQINDTIVNEIMRSESEEPGMVKAREIVERIHNRQLYQCIGTYQHAREEQIDKSTWDSAKNEIKQELVNNNDDLWQARNIEVDVSYFDYGDDDKNPLLDIAFYNKSNGKGKFLSKEQLPVDLPPRLQDVTVAIYTKLLHVDKETLKKAREKGNSELRQIIGKMDMSTIPIMESQRNISPISTPASPKVPVRPMSQLKISGPTVPQSPQGPSTSSKPQYVRTVSQESQAMGISESQLIGIAEDLGNHRDLHKLAWILGISYDGWLQYSAANTRQGGQICSDGTRHMLMDWKKGTQAHLQIKILRDALKHAGYVERDVEVEKALE